MGYGNILVTLDGSEQAERAIDAALRLARPGARLHLLSVIDGSVDTSIPLVKAMAASFPMHYTDPAPNEFSTPREVAVRLDYMNTVKDSLTHEGYDVTAEVCLGRVVETILDAVGGFDLLVMATHGRTGFSKFVLGSVTEAVLHKVSCPLLIAPARVPRAAHAREHAGYECILVSLDGSPQSEAILPEVEKLLSVHPTKVVLLRVAPYTEYSPVGLSYDDYTLLNNSAEQQAQQYLDGIAARLKKLGAAPIVEVNFNTPCDEIRLSADYYHADLIAMATHGRTGINRLLHGSVTEEVIHQVLSPMLIVRTTDA
jgi:nucleotide-binding universal stress UspA family protein